MKKQLLLICLIVPIITKGQKYYPINTISSNWNEIEVMSYDFEVPFETIKGYYINGDTIIEGFEYFKIYENTNNMIYYMGCIRESNKKIYYKGKDYWGFETDSIVLLYDFTKTINDTIWTGTWHRNVIENIDSIIIENSYRKRYRMYDGQYWIEGIGSTKGFLYPMTEIPTLSWYIELTCFKIENEIIYLNPNFIDCLTKKTSHILESNLKSQFKIYINQYQPDYIVIKSNQSKIELIIIYDISGRPIKLINVENDYIEMNISNLSSEIFIIKIIDDKGIVVSKLFIK